MYLLYLDSFGFAAANIAVLAFKVQTIPALAIEIVYYSITSWRMVFVLSSILSNSSIQQIPLSDNTNAPDSSIISLVSWSFVIYAVKPTAEEPFPDVYILLDDIWFTNFKNWDLEVDGSPISKIFILFLKLFLYSLSKHFLVPPNN